MRLNRKIGLFVLSAALLVSYENCQKVQFAQETDASNTNKQVADIFQSIKPAFAVRGMNCVACHGVIGSNVITDFGFNSSNFNLSNPFFGGTNIGRTAFNDIGQTDKDGGGGWQNLSVHGTVHIPKATLPAATLQNAGGVSLSFAQAFQVQLPLVLSSTNTMASGITPLAGEPALVEDTKISISYPSQFEIQALLPTALQTQSLAISPLQFHNLAAASISGLAADPSGRFNRNFAGQTTECHGDVVVKGTLFLKNLVLKTDRGGCRIYATDSVFIQGPISYVGGDGSHLQITSAQSVIIGFSAKRLGANQVAGSTAVRVASGTNKLLNGACNVSWERFNTDNDVQYDPSGDPVNGIPRTQFFDSIIQQASSIGVELASAEDPVAQQDLPTGKYSLSAEACPRVNVDYAGLLLNAPHVHSYYGGTFKGVIIGDVAMLARNPSNQNVIEQYIYDPLFDSVPLILPALSTRILDIQH